MKRIVSIGLFAAALVFAARGAQAQGCDALLRDGAFETLNQGGSSYSSDQWHNAWCNGTLIQTAQNSGHQAKLNLVLFEIPLGLSYEDAKNFQQVYQTNYCGNADRHTVDMSQFAIFRKTVSPDLVNAYVECHKTETSGLRTAFDLTSNNRVFVVTMRYIGDSEGHTTATLDTVSFKPASAKQPKCDGTLKPKTKIGLSSLSMSCERFTDGAITVFIGTSVGTFHRQVPATIPPPSDTERVMKAMPTGTILAWSSKAPIPAGWHVCDGTAGTPDMTNRYLIGTTDLKLIGTTTGSDAHVHSFSGGTSGANTGGFAPNNSAFLACCAENHNGYAFHSHSFTFNTPGMSNRPLSSYVLYIMKL